jgi:hypothetical protein
MASPFTNKLMKELLENVRVAIKNSLKNADVLEKVSGFGMNAEAFTKAEDLLVKAESLYMKKGPQVGQKVSLSIQVTKKIDKIYDDFMIFAKMIRTDLKKDPAFFSEFNLSRKRDRTITGKVKEPKTFYQNCLDNEKIGNFMATKHGLTREKIDALLAEIAAVEKELENKATMIKNAEEATQKRNEVFQELSDWWLNYRRLLTHVFQDDPQRLEEFNITAYSEGYKPIRKKKTDEGEENQEGESKGDTDPNADKNKSGSGNNEKQQGNSSGSQGPDKNTVSDKNEGKINGNSENKN